MRISGWALVGVFWNAVYAQPASITLRAKIRDFKEYVATDSTTHPDFENDAFMGCGGENLGYVDSVIGLGGALDTNVFRFDNREPILRKLNNPYSGSPCFTGFDKFKSWFNDDAPLNREFYADLVLNPVGQDAYSFIDNNFFPLDPGGIARKFQPTDPDPFGALVAAHPDHDYGFTLELHSYFTYTAGKGQNFSFSGDDDVWVFINGKLAIDLGGLHHQWSSTVNLDDKAAALGMTDGGNYLLDFFFAERHSVESHCQITTSLQLSQKGPLPIPVANPPGQIFHFSIPVALTVPGIPDAQIHYTVDGSEPTQSSPLYTAGLTFTTTTTLKVKAFSPDYLASPTLTEVYTREYLALPTPVANPAGTHFTDTLMVNLMVPNHPDAQIRYTLDGSEPTPSSPLYTAPLRLSTSALVKAKAYHPDYLESPTLTQSYAWTPLTLPIPVADPAGKTFKDSITVRLTVPGHPNAQIHYTLDGSEPTEASPLYTQPLHLTDTTWLKAQAVQPRFLPSPVLAETYVRAQPPNLISLRVATPVSRMNNSNLSQLYPNLKNPIALVIDHGGSWVCLSCPPGTEGTVLSATPYPEWVTRSRFPFDYQFQIYDKLGNFVVSQSGAVTPEMFAQAVATDSAGYRLFRFRWIPVAADGRAIGTGAYILRAEVLSHSPTTPSESAILEILKTFGYIRVD